MQRLEQFGDPSSYNHYEVGETLGHPYALLGRAALDMMKLSTA